MGEGTSILTDVAIMAAVPAGQDGLVAVLLITMVGAIILTIGILRMVVQRG